MRSGNLEDLECGIIFVYPRLLPLWIPCLYWTPLIVGVGMKKFQAKVGVGSPHTIGEEGRPGHQWVVWPALSIGFFMQALFLFSTSIFVQPGTGRRRSRGWRGTFRASADVSLSSLILSLTILRWDSNLSIPFHCFVIMIRKTTWSNAGKISEFDDQKYLHRADP